MTNKELAEKCGFSVINQGEEKEFSGCFCCDLLSHAMGQCPQNSAWFTVMGNVNTIAVAALTDAACVVLCHGVALMPDALEKAKKAEISVYGTSLAEFEAACAAAKG